MHVRIRDVEAESVQETTNLMPVEPNPVPSRQIPQKDTTAPNQYPRNMLGTQMQVGQVCHSLLGQLFNLTSQSFLPATALDLLHPRNNLR